ncbi:hypothetical protein FYA67_14020 [Bordetella holmesii]|nr:hypothetical protein FYB59_14015 [Bordetella holmesii]QGB15740.1 hypothetical protein FYB57_14020 [Bordetella holmesii]QGB64987.1 hypothetical protein FYB43_14015 [Bordetella holmesii]QGC43536.1 hypothetical protein FYB19_14025 [Bordetella holmesii]QGC63446.1 hypothetical protein FYB13_14015 [Bordetella holmesii]
MWKHPTHDVKDLGGPHIQFFYNMDKPLLQDIRVRKAIAHAISIPEVISTGGRSHGRFCPDPAAPDRRLARCGRPRFAGIETARHLPWRLSRQDAA